MIISHCAKLFGNLLELCFLFENVSRTPVATHVLFCRFDSRTDGIFYGRRQQKKASQLRNCSRPSEHAAGSAFSGLFCFGRVVHQLGYTNGYGSHAAGFLVATLATEFTAGLALSAGMRAA